MFNLYSAPTLINCTFSGNRADIFGGGIGNRASWPILINCTFQRNSAPYGGGVSNGGSSPTLLNCTFTDNHADIVGGAIFNGYYSVSRPGLANCILWGNTAVLSGPEIAESAPSSSYVSYSNVRGGYPGTGNINVDPCFVDAAAGDLRLQPGSPCINAGSRTFVTTPPFPDDGDGNATDLDGNLRIRGAQVDMGAYEAIYSNSPPVTRAGSDQRVECAGATTAVTLDGSASSDPDGDTLTYQWKDSLGNVVGSAATLSLDLADGSHTFTLTVTDPDGASDTDSVVVHLVDTTAPVIGTVSATPDSLWPPNHQRVTVTVSYAIDEACDPAPTRWLSVTSNEPDDGLGDGDTAGDIEIVDANTVRLRAERSGKGSGRVYTITVHCRDEAGNVATPRTVTVTVPKSQNK